MGNICAKYCLESLRPWHKTFRDKRVIADRAVVFAIPILLFLTISRPLLFFFKRRKLKVFNSVVIGQSENQVGIIKAYNLEKYFLDQRFTVSTLLNLSSSLAALDSLIVCYKNKKSLTYWWKIFRSLYCLHHLRSLVTKNPVSRVLLLNDHSLHCLCLKSFCKDLGIQTAYLQHAPVSIEFPPLNWAKSFLSSQSSFDTYSRISNITNQEICIGSDPKFFAAPLAKKTDSIDVLICTSTLTCISKTLNLAEHLNQEGFSVAIRNHPADRRKIPKRFKTEPSNSFDCLRKSKNAIVASPSGIVLEAIFSNCKTIYASRLLSRYHLEESQIYPVLLDAPDLASHEEVLDALVNNINLVEIDSLDYYIGTRDLFLQQKKSLKAWLK